MEYIIMFKRLEAHAVNLKRFSRRAFQQYRSRVSNFFYFYEDIPLHIKQEGDYGVIRRFGATKYKYILLEGRKVHYNGNTRQIGERPPIFLKVDRIANYTIMCIQYWVNVAGELGGHLYIVCDNRQLERMILKEIEFADLNFDIICSCRNQLSSLGANMYSYYWRNAAYAHLTPFYMAKKLGVKQHWDIDADDTMFLMSPNETAEKMRKVERKALEDGITAFSLDMWVSCLHYENWSMGIMFINDNVDMFGIFEATKSRDWMIPYGEKRGIKLKVANTDFFFGYLNDIGKIHAQSYYFDNTEFIHWDNPVRSKVKSQIYRWQGGKLYFPLHKAVPQKGDFTMSNYEFEIKTIKID